MDRQAVALEYHKDSVLLQVKAEEDSVARPQATVRQVRLGLVGLDAAQRGQVLLVFGSIDDRGGGLHTDAVAQQAACKQSEQYGCYGGLTLLFIMGPGQD